MTSYFPGRTVRVVTVLMFLGAMASTASAQEEGKFAKDGGYLGASTLLNFSFGADTFDGVHYYQREGGEEVVILPRFEGAHNALRPGRRVSHRTRRLRVQLRPDETQRYFFRLPGRSDVSRAQLRRARLPDDGPPHPAARAARGVNPLAAD